MQQDRTRQPIRFGSELTFIGTTSAVAVRRLPLITLPWVNEGPAALPVLMGRNGRPRTSVTLPGHNAGVAPLNKGHRQNSDRPLRRYGGCSPASPFMCRSGLFDRCMATNSKPNPSRSCDHCGEPFQPPNGNAGARRRFCSRQCGITAAHARNRELGVTPWQERFWNFIPDPRRPEECWEWQGARRADGYGVLMVSKTPYRTMAAHRASATIHHEPIPTGLKVLHSCDNPPCVNPAHLSIGTQRENVEDMMRKGRWGGVQGEASNLAKFPREVIDEVLRIKAETGLSNRLIGQRVGMSKAHVRRIVNGQARRVA